MLRFEIACDAQPHGLRARLEADEIRLRLRDMQKHDATTKGACHVACNLHDRCGNIGEINGHKDGFDFHGGKPLNSSPVAQGAKTARRLWLERACGTEARDAGRKRFLRD
jgi:hypothetical protein